MAPSIDTMEEEAEIKTMKLYSNVERIKNELAAREMLSSKTIDPIELSEIDSMHYEGNVAIEEAVVALKLDSSSKILDIGSGFGGPARVLSSLAKCTTTALELQSDIHQMAEYLTKKCDMEDLVKHEQGDILALDLDKLGSGLSSYDSVVSFLVFLHIQDKAALLGNCAKMLKPGGTVFFEDFYERDTFSDDEVKSLADDVYAVGLPTEGEYRARLQDAGFYNIQFIDKSNDWASYVNERVDIFVANRAGFEKVHGEPTYLSLIHFYQAICTLFNGENLGGVRIIAEKR